MLESTLKSERKQSSRCFNSPEEKVEKRPVALTCTAAHMDVSQNRCCLNQRRKVLIIDYDQSPRSDAADAFKIFISDH